MGHRVSAADTTVVAPFLSKSELREEYRTRTGIDGQLLSPWAGVLPTPGMSAADARSWAHRVNEAVIAEPGGAGPRHSRRRGARRSGAGGEGPLS